MLLAEFPQIQWREPLWLLLTIHPLVVFIVGRIKTLRQLAAYADKPLLPWILPGNRPNGVPLISSRLVYSTAWILLAIATAGPRYAEDYVGPHSAGEQEIALVVDVSRSMHTADLVPNRLQRVQLEIAEGLQRLRRQRVGLIVYAANAHLFVPLTYDYDALRFYLKSLDKLVLPSAGSRPQQALTLAVEELSKASQQSSIENNSSQNGSSHAQTIVLISDGDFTIDADFQNVLSHIKDAGIRLVVLGVGTVEGDVIPISGGGWLYQDDKAVISRLQESTLQKIAASSNGYYTPVQDEDQDWQSILEHGINKNGLATKLEEDDANIIWHELYQFALFPAVLLFFFSIIPYRFKLNYKSMADIFLLALLFSVICSTLWVSDNAVAQEKVNLQDAYSFYEKHNYSAAAETFTNLSGYEGRLGEGASHYRLEDYDNAIKAYAQAVLDANSDQERGVALYDLGNSYFQTGNYAEAARIYEDALRYRQDHIATRHNLAVSQALKDLVEKRRREIFLADRPGRGPRQAQAQQSLMLGDNNSVTLDQSSNLSPQIGPDQPTANLDREQLEYLIKRGLTFVRIVSNGDQAESKTIWYGQGSQNVASDKDVKSDNATLWQRLFEIEEGFPAPLDAPVKVTGVPPW